MELVITPQDLEPLPIQEIDTVTQPLGFLTSQYKEEVKHNFFNAKKTSLFGIKQRIKSKSYATCCSMSTLLKVTLFVILTLIALY
ncbi:hypothetical protein [Lacinutrix salivirga]